MLLSHGGSRESALLLQRGAVVGTFHHRIREEQSPATVAAAVALQQRGSDRPRERKHSRRAGSPTLGSRPKQSRDVASRYCCFDERVGGP
jgi:hypothetical protein